MPTPPLDAYRQVEKGTLSGRALEAMLLEKAAAMLLAVRNGWQDAERLTRLDEALRYNQRLWTVFQAEVAEPANPLPRDLKENLLSLSAFIDKRTFETVAAPSPEKLDVLITINRNIAAGLRGDLTPLQPDL